MVVRDKESKLGKAFDEQVSSLTMVRAAPHYLQ
jgi:hypothetical protein